MSKSLIFLFVFFVIASAPAQQDSLYTPRDTSKVKGRMWRHLKYDLGSMGGGFANAFTQPVRWQKDDYMIAGATIVGVSLLYLADEDTSNFFRRQQNDIPQGLLDAGWYFGRPEVSYGLTGGVYLFGLLTDNEKVREAGVLLLTSAAATGFFQQTMKTFTGRGRPGLEMGKNQFRLFRGGHAYGSFPSGHTILSTTTIYGLSKQFDSPWVKGGLYAVGLITPMNRLVEGAHWLTDVALSVVVSVAIVEGVDNYLKRKKRYNHIEEAFGLPNMREDRNKIKWDLSFGGATIGVVGSF